MRALPILGLLLVFMAAAPAYADAEGVEAHDGFFLRLTLGFGAGDTTLEAPEDTTLGVFGGTELSFSGFSGFFSVDVGASLVENLILHGRISDFLTPGPTVSIDGDEIGDADSDASTGWILVAPALTYYIMPANIYLTVAPGATRVVVDTGSGTTGRSQWGFGLNADAGIEWWVGDQWGLGAALRFCWGRVQDEDDGVEIPITGTGFGVLFSATYQ
jgi:hypothetical protein